MLGLGFGGPKMAIFDQSHLGKMCRQAFRVWSSNSAGLVILRWRFLKNQNLSFSASQTWSKNSPNCGKFLVKPLGSGAQIGWFGGPEMVIFDLGKRFGSGAQICRFGGFRRDYVGVT